MPNVTINLTDIHKKRLFYVFYNLGMPQVTATSISYQCVTSFMLQRYGQWYRINIVSSNVSPICISIAASDPFYYHGLTLIPE